MSDHDFFNYDTTGTAYHSRGIKENTKVPRTRKSIRELSQRKDRVLGKGREIKIINPRKLYYRYKDKYLSTRNFRIIKDQVKAQDTIVSIETQRLHSNFLKHVTEWEKEYELEIDYEDDTWVEFLRNWRRDWKYNISAKFERWREMQLEEDARQELNELWEEREYKYSHG